MSGDEINFDNAKLSTLYFHELWWLASSLVKKSILDCFYFLARFKASADFTYFREYISLYTRSRCAEYVFDTSSLINSGLIERSFKRIAFVAAVTSFLYILELLITDIILEYSHRFISLSDLKLFILKR